MFDHRFKLAVIYLLVSSAVATGIAVFMQRAVASTQDEKTTGKSDKAGLPSKEQVLKAYEDACSKLASFDVEVVYKSELSYRYDRKTGDYEKGEASFEQSFRQRFDKGKTRVEYLKLGTINELFQDQLVVWNGVGKLLHRETRQGFVALYDPAHHIPFYTNLYYEQVLGYPYSRIIRERDDESVKVTKEGASVVLEASADPTKNLPFNRSTYRLYFDPTKGYVPIKIDILADLSGKRALHNRFEMELAKRSGIWVPIKGRRTNYIIKQPSQVFGKELGHEDLAVIGNRSSFNFPIDASVFDLAFPSGTKVHDTTNGTVTDIP